MSHQDLTYVIFDGDNGMWAYQFMRGWNANKHIAFNFQDVHDIKPLREDASLENTIKNRLRERFKFSGHVIVLIGEQTKYLYRFVRWEIETAQDLNLPIIAVNLNQKRDFDPDLCPPILRDKPAKHVAFRARIIKYALDNYPAEFRQRSTSSDPNSSSNSSYLPYVYQSLGITD